MNTQTQEALKMALEALETPSLSRGDPRLKAIQACKEALEQPAQEPEYVYVNPVTKDMYYLTKSEQPAQQPVAWMKSALDNARDVCKYLDHDMVDKAKAHTTFFWSDLDKIRDFDDTHPAQPLIYLKSAQEKAECDCSEFYGQPCKCEQQLSIETLAEISPYGYVDDADIVFARAIEAKLKEKNNG